MAKKKEKEVSEVTLKDPDMVINLPRVGMVVNSQNLTVARYHKLINLAPSFQKYFNVKLTPKQNEVEAEK